MQEFVATGGSTIGKNHIFVKNTPHVVTPMLAEDPYAVLTAKERI